MSTQGRYSRQELFAGIGADGQRRLASSSVCLVGCGALGSVQADLLVRAGVGRIRIIDRDLVETSNLHRQVLFTEDDAARALPKATAAAEHLRRVNSAVEVDPRILDLTPGNAEETLSGFDLLLDGTDNFETRYLVNDVALKLGCPWIYGACVGAYGVCMVIRPGETACLRCLMARPPAPGSTPTCDTAGVIGPAVAAVASWQVAAALRLLVGDTAHLHRGLLAVDLWQATHTSVTVPRDPRCAACGDGRYEHLDSTNRTSSTRLCGRNGVQISPAGSAELDLGELARRLRPLAEVVENPFLVRAEFEEYRLTVFRDGRGIVEGTQDESRARSVYARYVGT